MWDQKPVFLIGKCYPKITANILPIDRPSRFLLNQPYFTGFFTMCD